MFVVEMVGYGFELYLKKLVDIEEMGVYFVIRIIYIVKEIILNIFKCYILVGKFELSERNGLFFFYFLVCVCLIIFLFRGR